MFLFNVLRITLDLSLKGGCHGSMYTSPFSEPTLLIEMPPFHLPIYRFPGLAPQRPGSTSITPYLGSFVQIISAPPPGYK
ncbi:unnamed protein product [Parascedosporium putredinis]|uniref:Uncharacterized protein n=1 Tax=Parascedosporium putredinis TaxID=1442378 RepID=A0A9P1GYA8_9PEZI|nr:unnamed protein product [Parascedosporium putredinis]CAI7990596.1 unnamed protein product [Parascedosporium putredinis]